MLRIASWNVNGIRAAAKGGFFRWLEESGHDVVLLQEVRALPSDLPPGWLAPSGYQGLFVPAAKKGYSGVGLYWRSESVSCLARGVGVGLPEFDDEGRLAWIDLAPDLRVASCYFPNSQRDHARLPFKLAFCRALATRLEAWRAEGRRVILGGDFNIAHTALDLANPRTNVDNAGFLPEERAWMDTFLARGWKDTFRMFTAGNGHYTWWSNRPGVRERNIGWRLDYLVVDGALSPLVKAAGIDSGVRGSDHCPVTLTLDVPSCR